MDPTWGAGGRGRGGRLGGHREACGKMQPDQPNPHLLFPGPPLKAWRNRNGIPPITTVSELVLERTGRSAQQGVRAVAARPPPLAPPLLPASNPSNPAAFSGADDGLEYRDWSSRPGFGDGQRGAPDPAPCLPAPRSISTGARGAGCAPEAVLGEAPGGGSCCSGLTAGRRGEPGPQLGRCPGFRGRPPLTPSLRPPLQPETPGQLGQPEQHGGQAARTDRPGHPGVLG